MYQSTSTCIAWVCHSPLHSRPLLPLGEEEYISKAHKSRLPMSFSPFTCSFDSSFFPLHRSFYYNLKSSSAIIYLHSCRQCLLEVAFKAALIHRCSLNTYESDPNLRGIHWDLPESLVHSAKGKQHGQKEEMPNMMIYLRTKLLVFIFSSHVETLRSILWTSWFHSLLLETCHINLQRRYVGWRLKYVFRVSIQY